MSVRGARQGIPAQSKQEMRSEKAAESERLRLEAARLLESPAWKGAVEPLKAAYLKALLNCPAKDDILRFRLQIALECIEKVEKHIVSAHSVADFDAAQAIRKDFATTKSLNPFRR